MKRFIIRSLLYLSPLFVTIAAVYFVDPYYLFHKERPFNEQKYEIGYSFDQGRRYKIFTYWNNPTDKIILGASEINIINERNIPEDGWHSLSYGGAPLQESLQMFWEVSKIHSLKKVIIAPEFIKYYNAISSVNGDPYYANFKWESSQSASALAIYNNKLDYFVDKYTLESTWEVIWGYFEGVDLKNVPKSSKKSFWKHQIDYANSIYGSAIVLNDKKKEIWDSFKKIKQYADNNGIDVLIIIPCQHAELLRLEFQEGIYDIYKDYIIELSELFGEIEYMAYCDGISEDDESFSDPFHCTNNELYIKELFGGNKRCLLKKESVIEYLDIVKSKIQ